MSTCKHCGEQVEYMGPDIGWVETRSGDDGGHYDVCLENMGDDERDTFGLGHVPAAVQ